MRGGALYIDRAGQRCGGEVYSAYGGVMKLRKGLALKDRQAGIVLCAGQAV